MTTGTELINSGAELLRGIGGKFVIFNSRFKNYSAPGWPDAVWFIRDTTFLIEVKAKGDKMRDSQITFAQSIADECGLHLRYRIINSMGGFEQIAIEGQDI